MQKEELRNLHSSITPNIVTLRRLRFAGHVDQKG